MDVVNKINFQSLVYEPTSYLNKELSQLFADMIWSVELHDGSLIKISILLEHKSYRDHNSAFQILEYLSAAYMTQLKASKPIELIIPILYYHGQQKWDYKSIPDFFKNIDPVFSKYIPSYHTEFINLQNLSENHIQNLTYGLLQNALIVQKHYPDGKYLIASLENILNNLNPYLQTNPFKSIFVYLIQNENIDKHELRSKIKSLSVQLNSNIMSLYDELIQEGIEKGKLEGKLEGIEEGIEKGIEKSIINAFDNKFDLNAIRLITGETTEKINEILKRNNRKN